MEIFARGGAGGRRMGHRTHATGIYAETTMVAGDYDFTFNPIHKKELEVAIMGRVRDKEPEFTLATPFIGRWYCVDAFLKKLLNQDIDTSKCHLLWVDSSNDDEFAELLKDYLDKYGSRFASAKIITLDLPAYDHLEKSSGEYKRHRHDTIAYVMEKIYQNTKGDLAIVEDDTFIPRDAIRKLRRPVVMNDDIMAACGKSYYWHKQLKGQVNTWKFEVVVNPENTYSDIKIQPVPIENQESGIEPIGASGTGCIYIKKEVLLNYHPQTNGALGIRGQDIYFGFYVNYALQKKLVVDWSISCPHVHRTNNGVVEVLGAKVEMKKGKVMVKC